jgi:hypothetical protein
MMLLCMPAMMMMMMMLMNRLKRAADESRPVFRTLQAIHRPIRRRDELRGRWREGREGTNEKLDQCRSTRDCVVAGGGGGVAMEWWWGGGEGQGEGRALFRAEAQAQDRGCT